MKSKGGMNLAFNYSMKCPLPTQSGPNREPFGQHGNSHEVGLPNVYVVLPCQINAAKISGLSPLRAVVLSSPVHFPPSDVVGQTSYPRTCRVALKQLGEEAGLGASRLRGGCSGL